MPNPAAEFRQEDRFFFYRAGHAVVRLPDMQAGRRPAQPLISNMPLFSIISHQQRHHCAKVSG
jgi:hypothetical protein